MMKKTIIPLMLLFGGVAITGLSVFWPSIIRSYSPGWTEEQAQHLARASANLHYLQHTRGHQLGHFQGEAPGEAEKHSREKVTNQTYEEAQQQFRESTAALEKAQHLGETAAAWMKWIGIALALGAVVSYYQIRAKTAA